MHIIAKYPYWSLLVATGAVLLLLALAGGNARVPAQGGIVAISGGGELIALGISSTNAQPPASTAAPQSEPAPAYVPIIISSTTASGTGIPSTANAHASSTAPQSSTSNDSGDALLKEVYALIPSGVALGTTKARTPVQDALFAYGNEAGLALLTFENAHTNMTDVLQTWLKDRGNAGKSAQVIALAHDLSAAGAQIAALPSVPSSIAAASLGFGQSMENSGAKLLAVAAANTDDTKLTDALKQYDASADVFTSSYLSIADILSLNNVQFGSGDPGSVFSFGSAGSF